MRGVQRILAGCLSAMTVFPALAAQSVSIRISGYRVGDSNVLFDDVAARVSPQTVSVWDDGRGAPVFTATPPQGEKVVAWNRSADNPSVLRPPYSFETVQRGGETLTPTYDSGWKNATYVVIDFDYIRYHLDYKANGGSLTNRPSRVEYIYTNAVTLVDAGAVREGYIFDGWTNALGTAFADKAALDDASPFGITNRNDSAEVVLYAKWIPIDYSLSYELNGGTHGEHHPDAAKYDEIITNSAPTRTGYSFTGWTVSSPKYTAARYRRSERDGWIAINEQTTCLGMTDTDDVCFLNLAQERASTVALTATWTANVYRVTFNFLGEVKNAPTEAKNVTYDSRRNPDGSGWPDHSISPPVYDGFTFNGYWTEPDGQGVQYWDAAGQFCHTSWDIAADTELFAAKVALEYRVEFDVNGGVGSAAGVTGGYDDKVVMPTGENLSHTADFAFAGWSVSNSATDATFKGGEEVTMGDLAKYAGNNHNITLYAVWRDLRRTVVFDANGGTVDGGVRLDRLCVAGEPYGELPAAAWENTHKTFVGWYTARTGGVAVTSETRVPEGTGDIVLWARWEAAPWTIVFDGNGATNEIDRVVQTFVFGSSAALVSNVYGRTGCVFAGWATNLSEAVARTVSFGDGEVVRDLALEAYETNVLYAVWSTNAYEVVYDANGGVGTMAPSTNDYGVVWRLPACAFSRVPADLYDFAGWSLSPSEDDRLGGANAAVSNLTDAIDGTVTLYALWKRPSSERSEALDCAGTLFFKCPLEDDWAVVTDEEMRAKDSVLAGNSFASVNGTCLIATNQDNVAWLNTWVIGSGTLKFSWLAYSTSAKLRLVESSKPGSPLYEEKAHAYAVWIPVSCHLSFEEYTKLGFSASPALQDDYCLLDNVRWIPDEPATPVVTAFSLVDGRVRMELDAWRDDVVYELLSTNELVSGEWPVERVLQNRAFTMEIDADALRKFYKVRMRAK